MPRSTNYEQLVSKHRLELSSALESICLQLKASYMWDLTSENCHQIYKRLEQLKIDSHTQAGIEDATRSTTLQLASSFSVIELHPWHNNDGPNSSRSNDSSSNDGIAFFGSIPQLVANINSILQHLDSASNRNQENESGEVFHEGNGFIDVSATLPAPRIMQDEEAAVLSRKYLLLHIRDYLHANIDAPCLNANDCARVGLPKVIAAAEESTHPWDLCFISGVFLGYPVVYCNSTPEQGNCLAHQPLCNYTVQYEHSRHSLYSFSVPVIFKAHYHRRIHQWFASLRQKAPQPALLTLRESTETHALILT